MKPRSSTFSPRLIEPEVLEQQTVAREPLLTRLIGNLSAAIVSGQGRFDLLVGPRGVGKSHMLGLVEGRLRAREDLRQRVVVVSLSEEFSPGSLLHLIAHVLENMPADPSKPPISGQLRALRGRDTSDAIDMAVAMIRTRLDGRSLLLMLENLDMLFQAIGRKAQAQLRKIVQSEQGWSIFATARSSIALTKQTEPFHGTFVVEQLETLTPPQCCEMMVRLARVHERADLEQWLQTDVALMQVRAAHLLVGGSPRVVAMLFHHLDPEQADDFEGNFYRLAEELTPYFQEQMAQLSAGQRPVMEFLAEHWAPVSVKEIAKAIFSEPSTVSTHLRALRRDRYVRSIAVGKERFYELAEPLHRVARAMKQQKRLGVAIAQMARVWAALSVATHPVETWPGLGRGISSAKKAPQYVAALMEIIRHAENDGAAIESHIEALAQHALGDPMVQGELIMHLLRLGRDDDALPHIEFLDKLGAHDVLVKAYLSALVFTPMHRAPRSGRRFGAALSSATITPVALEVAVDKLGFLIDWVLLRAASHLSSNVAAILPPAPGAVPDDILLEAALVVWLRGGLDQFMKHEIAASLLSGAAARANQTPNSRAHVILRLLNGCILLDETLAGDVAETSDRLDELVDWLGACIPLWLVSGRDGPGLLRALRAKKTIDLDPAVKYALAADDTPQAFVRMGAEVRRFCRSLLQDLQLDDVLAALPPEPTDDPI